MKAAIVVFPGTNRERDMAAALRRATGREPATVWHGDTDLPEVDLIVLPGGFTYGDYLRSGAMAARSPVMRAVAERARAGVPTLGVCNGFQILTEAGLLPGVLMRNAGLRFMCCDVHMRVEATDTIFTRGYAPGQVLHIPVANNEGNYYADDDTLDRLEGEGRIAFRYTTADGEATSAGNTNGSARSIAGILSESRTVLGLMPHPENAVEPLHGGTDGAPLFRSVVEALG